MCPPLRPVFFSMVVFFPQRQPPRPELCHQARNIRKSESQPKSQPKHQPKSQPKHQPKSQLKSQPTVQEISPETNQCPAEHKIYTMYHGTSYAAAKEIIKHGFKQSADGMLGRGVYVSRDIHKAKKYPLNNDPRKVVLKLRVNVGRVKTIDNPNHPLQKTWHDHGYSTAWVPPHTMNPRSPEEDCVYNPERIKVTDIVFGNPDDVRKLKLYSEFTVYFK